jgi:predicted phage tail protein
MDLSSYLPTAELQAEFEEYRNLKTDEERLAFQQKRQQKFNEKPEAEKTAYIESSKAGLNSAVKSAEVLIETVNLGEISDMISVAYIARNYFGKTRQWLYQRLKGYTVNGKPARFTEEEKLRLQEALQDISSHIRKTSFEIA